ncbi:MAG: glycosyltransferase, partial [Petrimonas sp.]|nr:glycosyltransferase [Petrimonas sp.]
DTDIFFKKSKEYCREQIHYPINQLLIITTGRLGWFKGWKFMIDSFLLFKSHFPASKLFFIGNGEDFQKITDYISLLNCNNDIELLGYQSQENISDFLNAADLFIMGSYKEGWSTSLMEAIACGVPACVTNFSSAKEIIAEGINGFVVEGHDEQLFSQTMIKALSINNSHLPRQIDVEKYSVSLLKQDLNNKWELV